MINKTVKVSLTQTEVSLARNLMLIIERNGMYFIDDIVDQEINQYSKLERIAYETLKSKLYKAEKELGESK